MLLGVAGDALSQHTLDKPPTSSEKLLLRWKRDVVVSSAPAAPQRTCLLAAHTTFTFLVATLLVHPAGSFAQF